MFRPYVSLLSHCICLRLNKTATTCITIPKYLSTKLFQIRRSLFLSFMLSVSPYERQNYFNEILTVEYVTCMRILLFPFVSISFNNENLWLRFSSLCESFEIHTVKFYNIYLIYTFYLKEQTNKIIVIIQINISNLNYPLLIPEKKNKYINRTTMIWIYLSHIHTLNSLLDFLFLEYIIRASHSMLWIIIRKNRIYCTLYFWFITNRKPRIFSKMYLFSCWCII